MAEVLRRNGANGDFPTGLFAVQTGESASAVLDQPKGVGSDVRRASEGSRDRDWPEMVGLHAKAGFHFTRNPRVMTGRIPAPGAYAVHCARGPAREDGDQGAGTAVATKAKPKLKRPSMYRVLLLNDDFTPMEFVVDVLMRFFNKSAEDATRIMWHVHQNGVGECGVYTYEIAETKVTQVMDFAREHQHPLQCVMEKK